MNYDEAVKELYVKHTPAGYSPSLLRQNHPGTIASFIPHSTYVMVDWVAREGTRPQHSVFEAYELTVINEPEYRILKEEVERLDRMYGTPPPVPKLPKFRVREGEQPPGVRILPTYRQRELDEDPPDGAKS